MLRSGKEEMGRAMLMNYVHTILGDVTKAWVVELEARICHRDFILFKPVGRLRRSAGCANCDCRRQTWIGSTMSWRTVN